VKTIPMGQGNKISRIVAWTFLKPGTTGKNGSAHGGIKARINKLRIGKAITNNPVRMILFLPRML